MGNMKCNLLNLYSFCCNIDSTMIILKISTFYSLKKKKIIPKFILTNFKLKN